MKTIYRIVCGWIGWWMLAVLIVVATTLLVESSTVNADSVHSEIPAPLAQSANVYVDRTAGSTGNGTSANPYRDVADGVDAVAENGTLWIRRGVYAAPLEISTKMTIRLDGDDPALLAGVGMGDTDGDELPDLWEFVGYDHDNDGRIDIDLPAMGADLRHKDIFVEVDFMEQTTGIDAHSHEPDPASIQLVVDAFNDAPVENPDGITGIHLHVDYGTTAPLTGVPNGTWGTQSDADTLPHQEDIGTCDSQGELDWSNFESIKGNNFLDARSPIFHYSIWGHRLCSGEPDVIGLAYTPGIDMIISLGDRHSTLSVSDYEIVQAVNFMHELGHNLGLEHGGDDDVNHKPNYLSIMNYSFSFWGLWEGGNYGTLDYSRDELPSLNENNLNENNGITLPSSEMRSLGTEYFCGSSNPVDHSVAAIDWNCDGDESDNNVMRNINSDNGTDRTTLDGFDDWVNLTYKGGGEIGVGPGGFPLTPIEPPLITPIDEPRFTGPPSSEPPPTIAPGDGNGDGIVDAGDLAACVLEIFDGDGNNPADAAGGSFAGTVGCDANGDSSIDAGDLSCTVLMIFNGPNACSDLGTTNPTAAQLTIGTPAAGPNNTTLVPITLTGNGYAIAAAAFALQPGENFDPADNNGDGQPDAVQFSTLPTDVKGMATWQDGQLTVVVTNTMVPLTPLPDGTLLTIILTGVDGAVGFDGALTPSLGSTSGASVPVQLEQDIVEKIFLPSIAR